MLDIYHSRKAVYIVKDLNKLFEETLQDVKNAGIKPGNILSVTSEKDGRKEWGRCIKRDGGFDIKISSRVLCDDIDDMGAKDTIAHEILHTCDSCMNHGKLWKLYADAVNATYPGKYHIRVSNTPEQKGIEFKEDDYKYIFQCDNCGKKMGLDRISGPALMLLFGGKIHCNACHRTTTATLIKGKL